MTNETICDAIVEMRDLADRLEAAHKREIEATAAKCCQLGRLAGYGASEIKHLQEPVGDAAKLREALKLCMDEMCNRCRDLAKASGNPLPCLNGCEPVRKAKAALAAPPRNCDKYPTFNDAIRALADKRGWHDAKWDSERYCILAQWLYAPAMEKEGGAK